MISEMDSTSMEAVWILWIAAGSVVGYHLIGPVLQKLIDIIQKRSGMNENPNEYSTRTKIIVLVAILLLFVLLVIPW
jgi:hypothetical protein